MVKKKPHKKPDREASKKGAGSKASPDITLQNITAADSQAPQQGTDGDPIAGLTDAVLESATPDREDERQELAPAANLDQLSSQPEKTEVEYKWRAPVDYFGVSASATFDDDSTSEADPSTLGVLESLVNQSKEDASNKEEPVEKPGLDPHDERQPRPVSEKVAKFVSTLRTENEDEQTKPNLNINNVTPPTFTTVSPAKARSQSQETASTVSQDQIQALPSFDTIAAESSPIPAPEPPPAQAPSAPVAPEAFEAALEALGALPDYAAITGAAEPIPAPSLKVEQEQNVELPGFGAITYEAKPIPAPLDESKNDVPAVVEPTVKSKIDQQPAQDKGGADQKDDDAPKMSPKMAAFVADMRESIISQREGKPEDWHPVTMEKKAPLPKNESLTPAIEALKKLPADFGRDSKSVKPVASEPERHLSLEELAQMDPDLALPAPTVQQQSIRRLKSKTTAGIRYELYLLVYFICIALSWCSEKTASAPEFKETGARIESAVRLLTPPLLFETFGQYWKTYEERQLKLHPFNAQKGPDSSQHFLNRTIALFQTIGATFAHIGGNVFSSAGGSLAQLMISLTYLAISLISFVTYFRFRKTTTYGLTDVVLLPVSVMAAASISSSVLYMVLSFSEAVGANYLPNTIVLFTTAAIVISVLDVARRNFFAKKQVIYPD